MLGADPTKVSLRAKKRGLPQARLSRPSMLFSRVLTVLLNVHLAPVDAWLAAAPEGTVLQPMTMCPFCFW